MKLFRFGSMGAERIGVRVGDDARDASSLSCDYDEAFFASGGIERLRAAYLAHGHTWPSVDVNAVRLGSVVARPSKIVAVGLNYVDHAKETGQSLPTEPKIFMKATTALCGVSDPLVLPRGSTHTDYEVELACVMGRRAKYVTEDEALNYVAGYTVCNDYSEREYQKERSGQFVKGKSADSFAPLGPYLVIREGDDFEDARLFLSVNDEPRQDARTSGMVYSMKRIVSCISQYMTLLPGDVITTGTPPGVGMGMTPPRYLQAGDVVHYGIEGIGECTQLVITESEVAP